LAELDLVLVTAPDRLACNYVHQVLLIDELDQHGCQVEFLAAISATCCRLWVTSTVPNSARVSPGHH